MWLDVRLEGRVLPRRAAGASARLRVWHKPEVVDMQPLVRDLVLGPCLLVFTQRLRQDVIRRVCAQRCMRGCAQTCTALAAAPSCAHAAAMWRHACRHGRDVRVEMCIHMCIDMHSSGFAFSLPSWRACEGVHIHHRSAGGRCYNN